MVMMVDLAGWSRFFVGATMGLGIDRMVELAIGKVILTGINITVGFSGLFL